MSTATTHTSRPSRSSIVSRLSARRSRVASRFFGDVTPEEGYSYALRIAFLHYLLQPRKKRKEYVAVAPKTRPRASTASSLGDLMKEFMPTGGSGSSSKDSSLKLPHSFRSALEKRMMGILQGKEKMPGYNDAAVKRTFGEAYTAFTANTFRKSIDKDRKIEPLILIFYTSASKAQGRGKTAEDDAWKLLVDRHVALFVRLVSSVLRDHNSDQGRPELMARLTTLEKKLLTNDQDLYIDTGQTGERKTVEVEIPLTYEVKDMPLVQTVADIFGRTLDEIQVDLDRDLSDWTEEAALKDLKQYQQRLTAGMPGALRRQDFDVDDAYEEWKKNEIHQLTQLMLDILRARPELAKTSTTDSAVSSPVAGKPLPARPFSLYSSGEKTYADLGRVISAQSDGGDGDNSSGTGSVIGGAFGTDGSFGFSALSLMDDLDDEELGDLPAYTFIPPDARACYRFILKQAMTHDLAHPDESAVVSEAVPLLRPSVELLVELAVHWRLTQSTRAVVLLDVGAQKYLEQDLPAEAVYEIFEDVKQKASFDHLTHGKKPPPIQQYGSALQDLESSRWTFIDYTGYQQVLLKMHDAMLRELLEVATRCYEAKPPSIGPSLMFIRDHIDPDELFAARPEAVEQFADALREALHERAAAVYRSFLDEHVPQEEDEWDFGHVVALGQAVVGVCERTRKRYRKNPDILGVRPFDELVATVFPSFEQDARAIIERVIDVAKARGLEVNMQDGFDLYKELVEIRKIHTESLPGQPFGFHVEGLLEEFVWRWIRGAQERLEGIVEEAIKQDNFAVRPGGVGGPDEAEADAVATDEERHSLSIVDTFQAFSQSVEQIYQLEWDDDVHHAKFMTALASAFSASIGRYCEIVEQRFTREMDRPSAQEVAQANKSTQERWMQFAKDALSTKEKMEPFQFYRESFVKLNNIEYAMQALDRLEKTVNVDGCAEVLRANGEIKPVDRRNTKYVFTVKIVEAEDLKACDPTGTSDPYVVLCDEYQKRLAKTRIIMRSLHPRWDESVEITVSGPLNIIATIWDYDTFGDHDFVGRTSLKLDPLHFSDFLPREFWLDLDTQGRLLLRVSMEGERDDIQFHFAKAFRHLKRTERDMVRKVTDKLVAHINTSLSYEAVRGLLGRGIASSITSVASLWQKRTSRVNTGLSTSSGTSGSGGSALAAEVENALQPLFTYFNDNFAIMNQTLTRATMLAVMTRLWKEVLMAIESLLVPPVSDKPSSQKALTQAELDIVYQWLQLLFDFFHARDDATGEVLGVPADILKSPKYHELASLNFFYFEPTENLIRTSERMAAATAQRAQQQMHQEANQAAARPVSAPPGFGPGAVGPAFASMGTIRRGKSIMMSRNLGTMRKAKEEKRREAQADPSDDMILRILRMRPEAAGYLKERYRQKDRMAAHQAAAQIVRQSINQGWSGPAFGGAAYSRSSVSGK